MSDNTSTLKRSSFAAAWAMTAVWFATHCGGGFATGSQELNFFVKYGWTAAFFPIISMLILGYCHRNALVIAKDYNVHDYRSYTNILMHPYEKFFGPVYDILFLMFLLSGVSLSVAGAASLLEEWGVPYVLGIVVVGSVLLLLTMYGSGLVVKVLNLKAYFMVVALSVVIILGLSVSAVNVPHIVATKASFGNSFGSQVWMMLCYTAAQGMLAFPLVSTSQRIKTTKECNWFWLVGTILNGIFLAAVCIMLLGFTPGVLKETLPLYYAVQHLNSTWVTVLYSIILFIGLLGTGVSITFSCVARFDTIWTHGKGVFENQKARRSFVSFVTIAVCTALSIFGLTAIVVKGMGAVGTISLFIVILPELFIAPRIIRKAAEARKQQGIDEETMAA